MYYRIINVFCRHCKHIVPACLCAYDVVGYTMDAVYFAWLKDPVEIDPDVQFPQFEHVDSLLYDCSMNYTAGIRYMLITPTLQHFASYSKCR